MKKRMIPLLAILLTFVFVANAAAVGLTVKGGWLHLRADETKSSKSLGRYYTGTVVTLLSTNGEWCKVIAPDGKSGYMMKKFLDGVPSSPSSSSSGVITPSSFSESTSAKVVSANHGPVRLRKGPGTSYDVYRSYSVGTHVTILFRTEGWMYIRVGSQKGWMMSNFISETTSSGPSGSSTPSSSSSGIYSAKVYAANGYPVNLRKGASKSTTSLAKLPVGTTVTVLSHGTTWDRIRFGSLTGYMMNCYLNSTSGSSSSGSGSHTLVGVTIDNNSPCVDDILYAVLSPSSAHATCEWYNDIGTHLATGDSYVVRTADAGRKIMVKATSSSGTTIFSGYTQSVVTGSAPISYSLSSLILNTTTPAVGTILKAELTPSAATATLIWYDTLGHQVGTGEQYIVQNSDLGHQLYCVATGTGSYTGTVTSTITASVTAPVAPTIPLTGTVVLPTTASSSIGILTPYVSMDTTLYTYTWYVNGSSSGHGTTFNISGLSSGDIVKLRISAVSGSGYSGHVDSNNCSIIP